MIRLDLQRLREFYSLKNKYLSYHKNDNIHLKSIFKCKNVENIYKKNFFIRKIVRYNDKYCFA